jgi:hypothetical protein
LDENRKREYGPAKQMLNIAKRAAQSAVLSSILDVLATLHFGPQFLFYTACNLKDFTYYSSYACVRWTWRMIETILTG